MNMSFTDIFEKAFPWLYAWLHEGNELNFGLLLVVWLVAFISLVALPPLVATLTGQGASSPIYARYALFLALLTVSVIGAPFALLGFALLIACASIPPLGRIFIDGAAPERQP